MPPRPKSSLGERAASTRIARQADWLEELARDPNLISGVHNYCDRWCERCPLTARCLVYQTEYRRKTRRAVKELGNDDENRDFWNDIADSFAVALALVQREAEQQGIDLNDPALLEAAAAKERRLERAAARSGRTLHRLAEQYWKPARLLLDRLSPELAAEKNVLNTLVQLGVGDPHGTASVITDALEVVQWYLYFIDVKLQRAASARLEADAADFDACPSDADGSAKIALIAIDRSIGAWARLQIYLPAVADPILDLLVHLERLRRVVEREFPKARTFVRPGFDAT